MSYCNIGDTPKVYFKFGSSAEQIYQSKISPIDVSIEDISANTPNYRSGGFKISCYSTNNERGYDLTLRDYEIRDNGSGFPFKYRYELWGMFCDSSALQGIFNVDPNSLVIDASIGCEISIPDTKKSKIHIKKTSEANDIFTATGDYPGSFKVACGDCPQNTCRCSTPGYPGYCCLPCSELKNEIREITNMVRRLE